MTTETSPMGTGVPLLELRNISKFFANIAMWRASAGTVACYYNTT